MANDPPVSRAETRTVTWAEAPEAIGRLASLRPRGTVLVVGITGPVGAGKSKLARRLGGLVLSTDRYLPDYDRVPEEERDRPEHADIPLLKSHLESLRRGERVEAPVWCFHAHRRIGRERVGPAALVVCEGIFALHETLRAGMDVRVYVEAPGEVRWARWERLERSGARGMGVEGARAFFEGVAEPTFGALAESYRAASDIVVLNPVDGPEGGVGA